MIQRLLIAFLVFLFSCTVGAQVGRTNTMRIIWSPAETCHSGNSAEVKAGGAKCSRAEIDGKAFYIIFYKGVSYAFNASTFYNYLRATAQISNNSGREIRLNLAKSGIYGYQNQKDFLAGSSKASVSAIVPAKYVSVTVIDREFPESVRTTEGAKFGVRTFPPRTGSRRVRLTDAEIKNELTKGALPDKGKIAGYAFFKYGPNGGFKMLIMKIDEIDFVFPIVTN